MIVQRKVATELHDFFEKRCSNFEFVETVNVGAVAKGG